MSQEGHGHQGATSDNEGNMPPATKSDSMSSGEKNSGGGSKTSNLAGSGTNKGKGVVENQEEEHRSKGQSSNGGVGAAGGRTDGLGHGRYGAHVFAERERRKKMGEMFTTLESFLPNLPYKTDKATMVAAAIEYIKSLEVTVTDLEKRKREMKLAGGRRGAAGAGASSSAAPPPTAIAPTQAVRPTVAHGWTPPPAAAAPALVPAGFQTWSGPNVVLTVSGDDAYIHVCVAQHRGIMTMVAAVMEKHGMELVTSEIACDASRSMIMIHSRINVTSRQPGDSMAPEEKYKLAASEMMMWLSN